MTIAQIEPEWKTIEIGDLVLKYQVREPSPNQWNVIGVVGRSSSGMPLTTGRRLVVGLGNTASEAMADMIGAALVRASARPASRRVVPRELRV